MEKEVEQTELSGKLKTNWTLPIVIVIILVIIIIGLSYWAKNKKVANGEQINVGVITDLSGPVSYWGESSRVGAEIAQKELENEGYKVNLIFEDYQLDAAKALTSAQKLIQTDNVDAIYAEFNPAAYSINPYIKDKNKIFIYDAAPVSPLVDNANAFKTYLDYKAGNNAVAQKFKDQGIQKIGVLKMNLEPGELGLAGVKEIFGEDVVVEQYDLGVTDLKTQVLKLKDNGVGAVMNVAAFEGDTLNALKAMQELQFKVPYGTVDDTITDNVKQKYLGELKGAWTFGFPSVSAEFSTKVKANSSKTLSTEYGAAITYTHIKQIVKSLDKCKKEIVCTRDEIVNSKSDNTIGFNKFTNRIADLDMAIKQY
jgi:ABC-type branched-subunit amino acid transport system substrate-binding protein